MVHGTAVFTIVAKNYLPHARVLMRSVAAYHPGWDRYVILADRVDEFFVPAEEPFELIRSADLPIPSSKWFHFKYTILELATAVKPYAFAYLFEKYGLRKVIYLDPDIRLYSPLDRVADLLNDHSIVLTPHLLAPFSDAKRPAEIDILRSGSYNLGFIALAYGSEVSRFVHWWAAKLYDQCVVDVARGLFVDQKWIDLVPGLFTGVHILRDSAYNVAYWNLQHRRLSRSPAGIAVDGVPLRFFHFSGYDPGRPDQLSRHQDRYTVADLPQTTRELLQQYGRELLEQGYVQCHRWPYAFARFAGEEPIPDIGRPVHHEAPELVETIEDPFSEAGHQAFLRVWNAPVAHDLHAGISRLAYRIYQTRRDVQAAMPDIFGRDRLRFLHWMLDSAPVEHGLSAGLLEPMARAIGGYRGAETAARNGHGQPPAVRFEAPHRASDNGTVPGGNGNHRLELTHIVRSIYEGRSDIQRHFPDPCGRDRAGFLVWLLTYGRKEHRLSDEQLGPMRDQWDEIVGSLPRIGARVRYELALRAMAAATHIRPLLDSAAACPPQTLWRNPRKAVSRERIAPSGINLVGYFRSEMGIGQSVRNAYDVLRAAGIPVSLRSVEDFGPSRKCDESAGPMSDTFPYSVNLFHVNADETGNLIRNVGTEFFRGHYNIGYWVWELEEFPDRWLPAFTHFQEIWTPSTFCREAIGAKSPVPVIRMPHAVSPGVPAAAGRAVFGLPSGKFVFLCAFDVLSVVDRKNPCAVIRAFERAFGGASNCHLVIKVNNAARRPRLVEELRAASQCRQLQIMDCILSRAETNALIDTADCVVSLHRAEGFGLVMAEAMYLGKPVIATDYSGNTDFTRPGTAFLVEHRRRLVGAGCEPYDPDSLWAEPDIDDAARQMRRVVENPDLRQQVAAAGQKFVRTFLSPEAVGKRMASRLAAMEQWPLANAMHSHA